MNAFINAEKRIQNAELRTLESHKTESRYSNAYREMNTFLSTEQPVCFDDRLTEYESRLTIPLSASIKFVALKNIIRFEAARSYTTIYTNNSKPILAAKSLKYFVDQIHPKLFFKSDRSNFVNLQEVREVSQGITMQIGLTHEQVATITKKNIPTLLKRMKNF